MFRKSTQRIFTRFSSSSLGVSSHINESAFKAKPEIGKEYEKFYSEKVHHAADLTGTWKKFTYFLAFPVILLVAIPVLKIEFDHAHHRHHMREIPDEEWPVQYDYRNLRQKKFFWGDGDKTLFWNSDVNRHIE